MTAMRGILAMDVTWRDYPILHLITDDAMIMLIGERSKFTVAETSGAPFHLRWDSSDKAPLNWTSKEVGYGQLCYLYHHHKILMSQFIDVNDNYFYDVFILV